MNAFENLITNIGEKSNFNPKYNKLLLSFIEESKKDYNKYMNFLISIESYWQKYKERSEISYLLKDKYHELFSFYLSEIFPLHINQLEFKEPKAPTICDFALTLIYHFTQKEIVIIESIRDNLGIKVKTKNLLRRIFGFMIASIGPIIEKVYGKPFTAQFWMLEINKKGRYKQYGEIEVICGIALREQ
ncbi:MAG: hypothetical protein ACFFAN_11990 [Promethearchaeota archaeon]